MDRSALPFNTVSPRRRAPRDDARRFQPGAESHLGRSILQQHEGLLRQRRQIFHRRLGDELIQFARLTFDERGL